MSRLTLPTLALLIAAGCHTYAKSPTSPEAQQEIADTKKAFLDKDPDLQRFFDKAYGYALFPNVGKGGLIVGGGGGRGYVFEQGKLIGTTKVTMISVGAQIGGQSFREVIFFENKHDLENFKEGNYEFGAGVSAIAIRTGVSKDAKYEKGVAVFTGPKGGLMAEASVKGQKFRFYQL